MPNLIEEFLPHRAPFLFVDEVSVLREGRLVVGHRVFRPDEPFFAGHFPGNPIVPGVILLEAMAQCAGAGLVRGKMVPRGSNFILMTFDGAKFHRIVRPGERLDLEAEILKLKRNVVKIKGRCYVDGDLAAEAICMSAFTSPATTPTPQPAAKGGE